MQRRVLLRRTGKTINRGKTNNEEQSDEFERFHFDPLFLSVKQAEQESRFVFLGCPRFKERCPTVWLTRVAAGHTRWRSPEHA